MTRNGADEQEVFTMNNIVNLEEPITKLFRSAIGDGYNEEEIEEMLADIDFHALSQAIFHNLETVYEYTVDCTLPFAMNYRGLELFPRAAFLYEDAGDCMASFVCCARSLELWMLEDASVAIVSVYHTNVGNGEFITNYRVYKGEDFGECGMCIDMEDFAAELQKMCQPYYEHQLPEYEL